MSEVSPKIGIIIQARTESSRMPRKVLRPLGDKSTVLDFLVARLRSAKYPDQIIIATSNRSSDDVIERECQRIGVDCFRGSANNLVERYFQAAKVFGIDIIVRITADCPLVDPKMLDEMLELFLRHNWQYMCNQAPPTYPDGFDIDIFTFDILTEVQSFAIEPFDLEHVTPFIKRKTDIQMGTYPYISDESSLRVTLDYPEDYHVIWKIVSSLKNTIDFTFQDVLKLMKSDPDLMSKNSHLSTMNDVTKYSQGEKLYRTAKKIIPGGNSLLSKRPEMFLPDQWPNYYSKSKGITVWDLDGQAYKDMSIMGIGTNSLGYANEAVDRRVIEALQNSNMSTLNPPEEVLLASRLLELHPWFQMARFARTGAEANSMALRIARVASGKNKVAICGYHGWHDWYLANNLAGADSLKNHLLPGLSPRGIPLSLGHEITSFSYNNFSNMREVLSSDDIGTVFMEVQRSHSPESGFLEEIREKCTANGIVLIFDECTSGFRQSLGGLHTLMNVKPDLATFGKALGNGYAITAVLGIESVMGYASETFLSSTFWTERIGFAAALATLDEMESTQSWKTITSLGLQMQNIWRKLGTELDIKTEISGIPALASHAYINDSNNLLRTYVTQEMLRKHKILASGLFYPSTAHSIYDIEDYGEKLKNILIQVLDQIHSNSIASMLLGPPAHSKFGRLN